MTHSCSDLRVYFLQSGAHFVSKSLKLQEGRQGVNVHGTHTSLSYDHFVSTWSTRTFLPMGDVFAQRAVGAERNARGDAAVQVCAHSTHTDFSVSDQFHASRARATSVTES